MVQATLPELFRRGAVVARAAAADGAAPPSPEAPHSPGEAGTSSDAGVGPAAESPAPAWPVFQRSDVMGVTAPAACPGTAAAPNAGDDAQAGGAVAVWPIFQRTPKAPCEPGAPEMVDLVDTPSRGLEPVARDLADEASAAADAEAEDGRFLRLRRVVATEGGEESDSEESEEEGEDRGSREAGSEEEPEVSERELRRLRAQDRQRLRQLRREDRARERQLLREAAEAMARGELNLDEAGGAASAPGGVAPRRQLYGQRAGDDCQDLYVLPLATCRGAPILSARCRGGS